MDIQTLVTASLAGGVTTTLATEILKSKYIPVQAQKYPRTTAAIIAAGVSGYVVYQQSHALLSDWHNWVMLGIATLLVASITYTHVVK